MRSICEFPFSYLLGYSFLLVLVFRVLVHAYSVG
jgi:hypothetical protein